MLAARLFAVLDGVLKRSGRPLPTAPIVAVASGSYAATDPASPAYVPGGMSYPYGSADSRDASFYEPSASTTGYNSPITGVASTDELTVITGTNGKFTLVANTTYDKCWFKCQVVRAANTPGVKITRSLLQGLPDGGSGSTVSPLISCTAYPQTDSLLVEDCTGDPTTPSGNQDFCDGDWFTVRRCDWRRIIDGCGPRNTTGVITDKTAQTAANAVALHVIIEQNYGHDYFYTTPDPQNHADDQPHNDCLAQIQGGTGAVIRGNSCWAYYDQTVGVHPTTNLTVPAHPNRAGTGTVSQPSMSCTLLNNNTGWTGGHVVTDNWFRGAVIPCQFSGGSISSSNYDMGTWLRNRFAGDALPYGSTKYSMGATSAQRAATNFGIGDAENCNRFFNPTTGVVGAEVSVGGG